ncbi:MAG: hypothetical protein JF567_08915 [Xanthomonadales bacterium]|nr:hypothetical protein [Xanthomonadales bacterium]
MTRYRELDSGFDRYQFTTSPSTLGERATNFWVAQLAAMDASFMGRPNDALLYFPIVTLPPKVLPDPEHYRTADARDWIIDQAKNHQIVMINEAHHLPQTRLLTISLLKPLHDAGFHYLALETLRNDGKNPMPSGYPETGTGEYTREPVMADLVREALRLGYTLVPYEASEAEFAQAAIREHAQAHNLATFLSAHPDARLLVHAGYAHIAKTDAVMISGANAMATDLIMATHARVLSVDQTELIPMSTASQAAVDAKSRLVRAFLASGPVVFLDRNNGTAWSSKPEAYDASVLLPPSPAEVLRPDWLSLGGIRRKVYVGADGCADRFPCLIQAIMIGQSPRAIAADQFVVLYPSEGRAPLFLRDGAYRLRYTTSQGQVVVERRIDVPHGLGELPPARKP